MNNWKLLVLALPLTVACGDKEIAEPSSEPSSEASSEPSSEASSEPGSEPSTEEVEPLEPVAIGFEYSGIWNEAGNDGAGSLEPYLFPDLNNSNGGEPLALSEMVYVTLASIDYFSLGSDATDEQRENETCSVYAWFDNGPANLLADDYDWSSGTGGTETYDVDSWQGFEGMLIFNMDTATERCSELAEGYSLETFDGMHFGLIFGGLSDYMLGEFEGTDWWGDDVDAQASYFTQYIAVNHPNGEGGYTFVGYDWTSSIFVEADPEECVMVEEIEEEICGLVETEEVDGGTNYVFGDAYDVVNPRYGYVQGNAWWYEDYPNLDLNIMQDWNR